jgi:F-type H+-transporting ATPase subunit alpha
MDIIEQFKRQLEGIQISPEIEEVGEVVEIKDGVAKISGLRGVENFEIIQFDGSGVQGLVLICLLLLLFFLFLFLVSSTMAYIQKA